MRKLAEVLAAEARRVRDILTRSGAIAILQSRYEERLAGPVPPELWTDLCSQTLVWARLVETLAGRGAIDPRAWCWIISQDEPLWSKILGAGGMEISSRLSLQELEELFDRVPEAESAFRLTALFECFLAAYDGRQRRRGGSFFTPAEAARRVVEEVDAAIRRDFGLTLGLADTATWGEVKPGAGRHDEPFVRILDPAAGSGVFLTSAIERIHRTLAERNREACCSEAEILDRWRRYVPQHLLPRLLGLELSPAACLAAHLEIAQKLAVTGYDFREPAAIQVFTADTLAHPDDGSTNRLPITVILGNPPFAALSQNRSPWIDGLLKGRAADGRGVASYFEVDGRPLGERKHWLHDDYVKFLRYAQWRIENAGCGVVGLVTNHSYLDNPTFRGVRHQLLRAFSRIDVIDLHGNRKKREVAPDGRRDENVFAIDQGVAISIFVRAADRASGGRKPPDDSAADRCATRGLTPSARTIVRRADLWGCREDKLRRLTAPGELPFVPIVPSAPYYFFTRHDDARRGEYERGWPLTEVMPVYVAAPVTARDGLVVAFTREELRERIAEFRDLSIPDATIRERYFSAPRTARYPPGDTRGWKLSAARERLAACEEWESYVQPCSYRPFDRRWVFWSASMVDWPRTELMRHLESRGNLALVARRQMPPGEPCRYFWVTDAITLDGVIRSDNRGGESLFPLFVSSDAKIPGGSETKTNLCPEFFAQASELAGLSPSAAAARRIFHYLYAMFFAPSYRERYAEQLRVEFPRVFLPRRRELFYAMSELGRELVELHLTGGAATEAGPKLIGKDRRIAAGFPKHDGKTIRINGGATFAPVSAEAWEWRVGGHQVCRKWLRDRKGRILTDEEIATYARIVTAASETPRISGAIDDAIANHGGWPDAFLSRTQSSPQRMLI